MAWAQGPGRALSGAIKWYKTRQAIACRVFLQELLGPQRVCSRRGLLWWQCNKGGSSLQGSLLELLGPQGVCSRRGLLLWQCKKGGNSSKERQGIVVGALHEILAPKVPWAPHLELVYRKQQKHRHATISSWLLVWLC